MKRFHIVYKTTNRLNNKIYVGIHSTNKLEDGYLGSGDAIKAALKKYGKANFSREILYVTATRKAALEREALIVDKEFIKRADTYNLIVGGCAGPDQNGPKNHRYGKVGTNAKKVRAIHKDGDVVLGDSIRDLSSKIGIARGNVRNLLKKQIVGKRGWRIELV